MRVTQHDKLETFRQCAMPLLMERECEDCVIIGILERLAEGKAATRSGVPSTPRFWAIENGAGDLCAVAVQTPPQPLLFSALDEPCAAALADHLHASGWDGDQFVGIVPSARALADQWRARCGRDYRLHVPLRFYRTNRVIAPPPAPGRLRAATSDDVSVLAPWIDAFGREIEEPFPNPVHTAQVAADEGRLHVWVSDEDEPRAICAWQGPTPNTVRIGLVYTPPEHRGRGYAANAVADLTRQLLASGRAYCTLFTHAEMPTPNGVYRRIGYQPVALFESLKFEDA